MDRESQTYVNGFNCLKPQQIHDYAENLWTEQNISSDHPDIKQFIERSHLQIVEECASSIQEFQKNVLPIWNSYQNNILNPTSVFNLKLSSVGGDVKDNYTPRFVVRCNEQIRNHAYKTATLNKNSQSQENVTFLCQCIFTKWKPCHVLKIINNNKFKLECRYLNEDVKKQYTVVKITNAFHIFTSQDANEKEEFVKHIRQCQWVKISHFSIFLYKIQMKHTKKFVSEIMIKNLMLKTEEMKVSQMNDCNYSNTNIGIKREWNDTLNDVNDIFWDNINELDAMNKIEDEEPSLKRRKLSRSNQVITNDDFHIKEETKRTVKNMNADIESKKQEIAQLWGIQISDIEEKLSLLSSIITGVSNVILLDYLRECDLNIQSTINYHYSHSLSGTISNNNSCSNTKEQEDADSDIEIIQCKHTIKQENIKHYSHKSERAFFNCETDIERNHNNNNKQLQLTEIQSIILYKSAKKCQGSLQLDSEYISRKQIIMESIQEFGQDLLEWKEPNDSQYNAICKSISSSVSLIHGPPGTGKTSASAQLINAIMVNNLLEHNRKIFVCTYTHNAINELLQKISVYVSQDVILRLGDKDKCPKAIRKYCLEQKMKHYEPRNQDEKEAAWKNIFDGTSVIIGTVYSATSYPLMWYMEQHDNKVFNWLLIDECTQVVDTVLTIGVNILDHTSNSHLILIGDHKQLPPVIKSNKIKYGFKTVFETLVEEIPINDRDKCSYYSLLDMQYRMPECLIQFSNKEWYNNKIQSYQKSADFNDNVLSHINDLALYQISTVPNVTVYNNKNVPIYIIKIPNAKPQSIKNSWKNEAEGKFICQYILECLNASITVGIVSFYKPQAQYIQYLIKSSGMKNKCGDIMSQTVDAFQGKQKDLIILSTVANVIQNKNNFNNDPKRINVALTRCKKALIVVTSFDITKAHHGNANGKTDIWKRFFRQFHYGSNKYEQKMDIQHVVNNNNNSNRNNGIYSNNFNTFNVINMNNKIQANPIVGNDNHQEVWDFLSRIKLTVYYDKFISNGFDRMDIVQDITIDDLQRIGIYKWGHQKAITRAAKKEIGVSY